VFVLSRVREAVDRGMSTDNAVAHGIKSTAGIITSAAAVMVITFAMFATGDSQSMKQLGVGLAAAILIDVLIVRMIVSPALIMVSGVAYVKPSPARLMATTVTSYCLRTPVSRKVLPIM
jgi:uncharacterized membrane protein YdfJ with MMPL/SSD domain